MKKYKYEKYFTFEGHRYKVVGDTLDEVCEKKAKKLEELKTKSTILSPATTVDQWAEVAFKTYKSHVKGLKEMKLRYYKYVSPVIGFIPISKVRAIQCQNILNECRNMSFSHVTKLRAEIKFLFSSAKDNQLIITDPTTRLTLPEYEKGVRRALTDNERKHIYKVAEEYEPFLFFVIMLETGARPSEVMNLTAEDIDHENRLLHIRGTKTPNSDRFVPIPSTLYDKIKNVGHFTYIVHTSTGRQHDKDSYRHLRDRLYRELNLSMGAKTYRNALVPPLPLAEDFTPYCLRHTYCSDLCRAGVDIRTAQKLMGHANISITADIYTHTNIDEIKKAGELWENYWTVTTPPATPRRKNA